MGDTDAIRARTWQRRTHSRPSKTLTTTDTTLRTSPWSTARREDDISGILGPEPTAIQFIVFRACAAALHFECCPPQPFNVTCRAAADIVGQCMPTWMDSLVLISGVYEGIK